MSEGRLTLIQKDLFQATEFSLENRRCLNLFINPNLPLDYNKWKAKRMRRKKRKSWLRMSQWQWVTCCFNHSIYQVTSRKWIENLPIKLNILAYQLCNSNQVQRRWLKLIQMQVNSLRKLKINNNHSKIRKYRSCFNGLTISLQR